MSDTGLTHFFGDTERRFQITPALIPELERVTQAGIGALYTRVSSRQFNHGDMVETIRVGLIGGGATPKLAADLSRTYAAERPIIESYSLALDILEALWFGAVIPPADDAPPAPLPGEEVSQ